MANGQLAGLHVAQEDHAALSGELEMKNCQKQLAVLTPRLILAIFLTFLSLVFNGGMLTVLPIALTMVCGLMMGVIFHQLKLRACALPKSDIHRALRETKLFRPLANHLMKVAGVPTIIPAGAMNVMWLGHTVHTRDASPLDWPVYWYQPDPTEDVWHWRRTDLAVFAVQSPNGTWWCISAAK
ncbi:MAG: hypothetical protein AAB467_02325 [Patescibacteria group bacterium]